MNSELSRHRQRVRRQRRARRLALGAMALAGVFTLVVALIASAHIAPSKTASLDLQPIPTAGPPSTSSSPSPSASPTPDTTTPLARLAVLGDSGTRDGQQAKVAAQVAAADKQGRPFDALLITGDLVYSKGDSKLTEASVVRPYAGTFTKAEIIGCLGNHDIESGEGGEIMQRLGRPAPVYTQDVGPVKVLTLNSNRVNSGQTQWLSQVLATPAPPNTWVIPIMHHPPYSSSKHGSEMPVRRAWVPLFARYGVKLVLAGHDHDYERTNPQNGVTYVVSGGGGAELYNNGHSAFTAISAKKHHFVDLTVFSDRIEGKAIDDSGTTFDTFTIQHGPATTPLQQAQ